MALKSQYEKWVARAKANGDKLISYNCPHCKGQIETLAAPEGEVWDTLSACPECPKVHMKITRGSVVQVVKV